MGEQYSIEHRGRRIEVEADESLVVVARVRLFVDGRLADERVALWEARLHGELREGEGVRPVKVEVVFGLFGGVQRCVLIEDGVERRMSRGEGAPRAAGGRRGPARASGEKELLFAMRENGGEISAVEAAATTSLSVKEADEVLSGLAAGGHLLVERRSGVLVYVLPGRRHDGIAGRSVEEGERHD